MVDNISAPPDDRCALQECRRPRSEHTNRGHVFVSAEQLSGSRPRPRDPLRDIRRMTDKDRFGAESKDVNDGFTSQAATEAKIEIKPPAEPLCQLCDRVKRRHRGAIGHRFLAPGEDPAEVKPTKSERTSIDGEPKKKPGALTLGMIAAIVDDAIRGMNTPSVPMIDDIHISPEFNIDRTVIIAARVKVTFSVAGDMEK
jgi:hypothetical protein